MKRKERVAVVTKEIIADFPEIDKQKLRVAVDRGIRAAGRIAYEEHMERKRQWETCGKYICAKKKRKKNRKDDVN